MSSAIEKNSVVSLHYTLRNDAGEVMDSSQGGDPLTYLHGANNLIPGLELELEGKATGDSFSATIPPDQAYGEVHEEYIQVISREMFQGVDELEVGKAFMAQGEGGEQQQIRVTAIEGDDITIDANHPMAGLTLHFEIEVVEVREGTEQEIAHGHVHRDGADH